MASYIEFNAIDCQILIGQRPQDVMEHTVGFDRTGDANPFPAICESGS